MTIKNQYRDVTLQEISEGDIGKELRVAGWIENIRDHGGVSFVDLRDMYGVLQVVMRDTSLLEGLSKEMSVSIEGLIEKRDEETYNPKIPTGTIELEAHSRALAIEGEAHRKSRKIAEEMEDWLRKFQAAYDRLRGDVDATLGRAVEELRHSEGEIGKISEEFSYHDAALQVLREKMEAINGPQAPMPLPTEDDGK